MDRVVAWLKYKWVASISFWLTLLAQLLQPHLACKCPPEPLPLGEQAALLLIDTHTQAQHISLGANMPYWTLICWVRLLCNCIIATGTACRNATKALNSCKWLNFLCLVLTYCWIILVTNDTFPAWATRKTWKEDKSFNLINRWFILTAYYFQLINLT